MTKKEVSVFEIDEVRKLRLVGGLCLAVFAGKSDKSHCLVLSTLKKWIQAEMKNMQCRLSIIYVSIKHLNIAQNPYQLV